MNDYRAQRCCRATCARVATSLGLNNFLVTGGGYQNKAGGSLPMDSMVAEMMEVRPSPGARAAHPKPWYKIYG